MTAATLYFGAKFVIDGSLTVGELVAFNMLGVTGVAARVAAGDCPGAARQAGRAELEFLPAALEIMETPPSPTGRAIAASIIGFSLIALGLEHLRQRWISSPRRRGASCPAGAPR